MKKNKVNRIITLILVLICMNVSFCMAKEPVIYNSYAEKNELHMFVGNAEETDKVSCQIGNVNYGDASVQKADRLETYLLVDNSLSIADKYRDTIHQILEKLVSSMPEQESMTIATFDTDVHYLVQKSQSKEELEKAVDQISYQNLDTKITDVIYRLCKTLEADPYNGLRRIILISDGAEFATVGYTRQEVQTELQKLAYPLYTVGCTYKENTGDLEEMFSLSRLTGAEYVWLDQVSDTDIIVNTLNTALQAIQVTVPLDNSLMDGSSKGIRLTIQSDDGEQSISTVRNMPFSDVGTQAVNGVESSDQSGAEEIVEENEEYTDSQKTELIAAESTDEQENEPVVAENTDEQESESVVAESTDEQENEPVVAENIDEQKNEPVVAESTDEQKNESVVAESIDEQENESVVAENTDEQKNEPVVAESIDEQENEPVVTEPQTNVQEKKDTTEKKEDPLMKPMLLIVLVLLVILLLRRKMTKEKNAKKESTAYDDEGELTMYGDEGELTMYGDEGEPTMYGDEGEPTMYGNEGEATMYGDDERTTYGDDEITAYRNRRKKYIMVRFTDMRNPDTAIEVPLFTEVSVGRDRKVNPVAFENETTLSPVHCKVVRSDKGVFVADLNSANGTWVDDVRVEDEMELYSGAVLRMGQLEVIFEIIE